MISEPNRLYLFGAVCPEHGTGAALVLPFCNTEAMQLHLDEIAATVSSAGAHAIVILDQAGWHGAKGLKIPRNLSLLAATAMCARAQSPRKYLAIHATELAVEPNLQTLPDDVVDHRCYAWNTLINQPWKIMTVARRDWAVVGQSV